ncbi:MAG: FAD-binding oxidoreductase [Cystobacterineae bacterium]|nr:FAD-binding oxidoreductase [Cystobacterineae bacterium]
MPFPSEFWNTLKTEFPENFFSTEEALLQSHSVDWTTAFSPQASLVVFPRTTEEISRYMALCTRFAVPVVPSGGRTGLAGGAVATQGETILSLEKMRALGAVDVLGQTLEVEAGVPTEAVHEHCAQHGLFWPIDLAAKGSSQIGGNLATNVGGVRVIRYGLARQWVLGMEVVLPNGTVLQLNNALEKNNTGIDLRQLFIGSEGILGIISKATLKLVRIPPKPQVLLLATHSLENILSLFLRARQAPFTLCAFEFFTSQCLARVQQHRKRYMPLETPASHYALLEVETENPEALEAWVGQCMEDVVVDGILAQGGQQARQLWELRESISESLSATGMPHKNDIALPIAHLLDFCKGLEAFFADKYPGWEVCLFGHIGDGNLHVNVLKPPDMDKSTFLAKTSEVDNDVFSLVKQHHGSISAEHGIGLLKRPYLHYSRTPEELNLMRMLKKAVDPLGILNPGKVLPPL